jgi:hypothetical protein
MERSELIEHAIEKGRQEGPRFVAELSREARQALEAGAAAASAGLATAWSEVVERLRPAPRRPSAIRLVVLAIFVSVMVSALAIAVSALWERARGRREEDDADAATSVTAGMRAVVPVPVASDDEPDEDAASRRPDLADEAEERIAGTLAS